MPNLSSSLRQFLAGFRILLVFTVLCGLAYPLLIAGVAQVVAPAKANGSRVEVAGKTIGSSLIAQPFDTPEWFQPRPSAAGENGYDTLASSASNLGPNNEDLVASVKERKAAYAQANGVPESQVPADAVTTSGSGLDPDISLENARLQSRRVAQARGLDIAAVQRIVEQEQKGRTLGVLGEARVNVLELNLELQKLRQ